MMGSRSGTVASADLGSRLPSSLVWRWAWIPVIGWVAAPFGEEPCVIVICSVQMPGAICEQRNWNGVFYKINAFETVRYVYS